MLSPLLFSIYTNVITSACDNVTVLKYADDTCIIGCVSNPSDLAVYFDEVNRIAKQCHDLDLILNPRKTKEILFSTQRVKPTTPALVLNNTGIEFCASTKYLGVLVDDKLQFGEHINNIVTIAKQRMHIVRLFYHIGSPQLAMLFVESYFCLTCYLRVLSLLC